MPKARKLRRVSALGFLLLGVPGCKNHEAEVNTITLTGTVEKIDLVNQRVEISFYSEKYQRNHTADVQVTPETEILINGIAAKIADVRVGERAEGEALMIREGNRRVIKVLRVRINRPRPVSTTSPAAEETAGRPAPPDPSPKPKPNTP